LETLALHESDHYSQSVRLHKAAAFIVYFREAIVMPEISEYVAKFDQNALDPSSLLSASLPAALLYYWHSSLGYHYYYNEILLSQCLLQVCHVTLSHLRSKEFQRIHEPCIPHHRDTSKCTPVYIEMYPGKVVALQKVKPPSSKQGLP